MRIEELQDERGAYLSVECPGGTFLIDAADREIVEAHPWRIYYYKRSRGSYVVRPNEGRVLALARQLMDNPPGMTVDHWDGNRMNNRRYNLNICTDQENLFRKHVFPKTASGLRGAYQLSSGRWFSIISIGGQNKKRYLGTFDTAEQAARAFDKAARELRGKFALLNFPEEGDGDR